MNTQENNKMIAEFMQSIEDGLYLDGLYFYNGRYYDTNMEFHKSWDWLMPVVDKMNTTELWDEYDISDLAIYIISVDISLAYKSVVEFINQYNKN